LLLSKYERMNISMTPTDIPELELAGAQTTVDAVTQALRRAILGGSLAGGQILRQESLANQLGVSRLPVREAIRQLNSEGLVQISAHRGAVVAALSADDIREIYDIRVGLETTALRLALPHLSPAILRRAAMVMHEIESAADAVSWGARNWLFHITLYTPAQRPRLLALIRTMHDNVGRYLQVYPALIQQQHYSQQEHQLLLAACQAQDEQAALRILRQHLEGASERLATFVATQQSAGKLP
jgi:DNA-binding GntR family transcriptional regulator